ncbi:MAG: DinB family protein [Chloroflexi bacterium]|nr:DinB family protein [Chloroflexota bacterium]
MASMRSPDPITEATAYQQHLLALVGDDDPALAQESTIAQMRRLLTIPNPRLRTRPAQGEWSAIEVAGHILDAEIVYSARYRWILAHDEPELIGYDQDRWVERLGYQDAEPNDMAELFEPLRRANVALWRKTPSGDRARVGMHRERGPESFELSFRLVCGHDRLHLRQAWQTLEATGAADAA